MKTIVLSTMINHDYRSLVAEQGRWSKCFECGVGPFNEDVKAQIELDVYVIAKKDLEGQP